MHYILLLMALLFFPTSCQYGYQDVDFDDVEDNSSVDADEIIYALNTWVETINVDRKHQIIFEDSRIFYNDEYIEKFWLKFVTQDIVDIWQARKIITEIVEGWVERFNHDPRLYVNALDNELSPANIDVTIIFESWEGLYIDPLYVASINLQDGMVYYYAYDVFDPSLDVWHQRVEPYNKTRLLADAKMRATIPWTLESGKKKKSILNDLFNPKKI